nr:hypothetical protein [Salipiger mucosus]
MSRTAAVLATMALPLSATAQEDLGPRLSLELNTTAPAENGCTLTFLALNGHESDIQRVVFEAVLFDTGGQVDRLTLFDFGTLPAGRPRVRQFVVPGLACDGLGQILINGASTCEAGELGAGACSDDLLLETRTETEVIG